jgi:hypothetical protein
MTTPISDYVNNIEALPDLHHRVLFSWDPVDVERFRLRAVQRRFSELHERVGALRKLADIQGVTKIETLDDAAPVLFQHTVYKSYPMSFLEQGKFGALNKWLQQLTTHDLSVVKAEQCHTFEEWFRLIEEKTPITPIHTTGTSGKLSVIPRTARDTALATRSSFSKWHGVGHERDMPLDFYGPNPMLPVIHPTYRYGFYSALRLLDYQIKTFSADSQVEALYNEWLNPDVLSLAGRVMTAEARGELDKLKISPELMQRYKDNQARQHNKEADDASYFDRLLHRFQGRRVMMAVQTPLLHKWALEGQKRGIKNIFAADSYVATGGGFKGAVLDPNWKELAEEVVGAKASTTYGMSEVCATMNSCSHGNYHIPPYLLPYVLDEVSGAPLPRKGQQTGRAAFMDLLPDSYWGGFVTGDEITMNWDGGCGCGRKGEYVLPTVRRFSDKHGGEDKISCAGAPDAQEKAMEFLNKAAAAH